MVQSLVKILKYISPLLFLVMIAQACSENHHVPKPKGYNRIELPTPAYKNSNVALPYSFELSKYANQYNDTSRLAEKYWTNIIYQEIDANIQLTYKPVQNSQELLADYLGDAYKLTSRHQIKAYSIEENIIRSPNGHTAVVQELIGEVPTPFQFFITDSTSHFLRAALYFQTATANDSLAPIIEFIKNDMLHIINTFQWNDLEQSDYRNQLDSLRKSLN